MIDLSIIIVNWNTRQLLADCLATVYEAADGLDYEVFVVDNASMDGSAEMVRERFPQASLIENVENKGYAAGNNQAYRECQGRYILLLNPDTKVLPNALQTLLDFVEDHPRAGAIGPMVLNPDLTLQSSVNPMMTLGREFWRLMLLDKVRPRSDYREESWDVTVAHEVEVIQGDCLLVRREALPSAHVLDEAYFMYTEEVDLCYRLLQAGWLLYWVPMARIIHYGGQSTRQVRKEMFVQLYRSKVLFFRKNKGAWAGQLYKSMLFVVALMRVLWGSLSLQRAGSPSDERFHLYRDLLRAFPSL